MNKLNIQEYLNILTNLSKESGIDLNLNLVNLALYKFFQFPAIKDFYTEVKIKNNSSLLEIKIQESSYNSIRLSCIINNDKSISLSSVFESNINSRIILSNKEKESILELKKIIEESINFKDLSSKLKNYNFEDEIFSNRVSEHEKDFIVLAKMYQHTIEKNTYESESNNLTNKLFDLLSNYYIKFNTNTTKNSLFKSFIDIKENTSIYNNFSALKEFMAYEIKDKGGNEFHSRTAEEKFDFFKELFRTKEYRKTIAGALLHSEDSFIDIIDNIIFDKFKESLLLKLKYTPKEKTLDQLYENHPIIEKLVTKISVDHPYLYKPLIDRIEHKILNKDSTIEYTDTVYSMDSLKIYGEGHSKIYLSNNFDKNNNLTTNTLNFYPSIYQSGPKPLIFIGKDEYNPYYIIYGFEDVPLTLDSNCYEISSLSFAKNLPKETFIESIENIYLHCMRNKLSILCYSRKIEDILGKNFDVFIKIKEKYEGIVPTILPAIDKCKLKIIEDYNLSFEHVLKIDSFVEKSLKENKAPELIIKEGKIIIEDWIKLNIKDQNVKPY